MNEIWKDIEGYEGLYQVSNLGNVANIKYGYRRYLTPTMARDYLEVSLCKDGKRKHHTIHRLVAKAFCDGYEEGLVVNHIDEDKLNNTYTNLEWVSISYNSTYGSAIEKRVATMLSNKGKRIYCIELDMYFETQKEAARHFGCCNNYISFCLNGKAQTVKGYHIVYVS